MDIQNIMATDSTQNRGAVSNSSSAAPTNELGKDEFLQLLVIQLENQDPLNPMDNTQMIAQLAQFSALEQMQNLNSSFTKIQHQGNLSQAMVFNGRNVHLEFQDGSTVEGLVEKVLISKGELYLQIDGQYYPAGAVVSVAFLDDEESGGAENASGAPDSDVAGGGSSEPSEPVAPSQPDSDMPDALSALMRS